MKIEEVIKQLESIADHTRSMAASPDADEIWKEDSDALEFAITALRSMQEAGEPLSLEQLQEMDGQPAYWPEDESWGIVSVDSAGKWAGKPFFRGRKQEVNFEYDIESRGMEVYAYPSAHIDRSEREPCEHCKPSDYPPDRWGAHGFPVVGNEIYFYDTEYGWEGEEIKYCPWCGRPLAEEAWAELERRLRG